MSADRLMRAYLLERDERLHGGVPSQCLFYSVAVSRCCGQLTTRNRRGRILCLRCWQPCELKSLDVPRRAVVAREKGGQIHVKAQPHSSRPDLIEDARVAAADRWAVLRMLFDPVPAGVKARRWRFVLLCWEGWLDSRSSPSDVIERGKELHPDLPFKSADREEVIRAVNQGRKVVDTRCQRHRHKLEPVFPWAVS